VIVPLLGDRVPKPEVSEKKVKGAVAGASGNGRGAPAHHPQPIRRDVLDTQLHRKRVEAKQREKEKRIRRAKGKQEDSKEKRTHYRRLGLATAAAKA
jgi:hypothetical protein